MGARCPACGASDRGEAECSSCGFPLGRWRHRDPGRLSEEERARYEHDLSLASRRHIQNRLLHLEQRVREIASTEPPRSRSGLSLWAWLLVPGYGLLFAIVSGGFRYLLAQAVPAFRTWFSPSLFSKIAFSTTNNEYNTATGFLVLLMGLIFLGWIWLILHDYETGG